MELTLIPARSAMSRIDVPWKPFSDMTSIAAESTIRIPGASLGVNISGETDSPTSLAVRWDAPPRFRRERVGGDGAWTTELLLLTSGRPAVWSTTERSNDRSIVLILSDPAVERKRRDRSIPEVGLGYTSRGVVHMTTS